MEPRDKSLEDQPWLTVVNGRQVEVDLGAGGFAVLGIVRGQALMALIAAFEGVRAVWPEGQLGEKHFTELMEKLRSGPHTREIRKFWHGFTGLFSSAIVSWRLSESVRGTGLKVPANLRDISNVKKRRRLLRALPTEVLAHLFYAAVFLHERHSREFQMEQSSSRKEDLADA